MLEKNPYATATNAYGTVMADNDPRALEGKLLLKAAHQLETLANRLRTGEDVHFEESGDVLEYNQKLWTVFVSDTMNEEHPLPQDIKNNIASLGIFIFNRTKDLYIDCTAEKLKVLIDINRNIAAGLMKKPELSATPAKTFAPPSAAATPSTPAAAPVKQDTDSFA